MKDDIPRDEDSMRFNVKNLKPFNIEGITKKNTFPCPLREFVSSMRNGWGKTQATKNFEMRIGKSLIVQFCIW